MISYLKNVKKCAAALILALALLGSGLAASAGEAPVSDPMTQGQENTVKRARQLIELEWTPLQARYQWGYAGAFEAGVTYTGAPYGQPVNTGYIGYKVSIAEFIAAVEDNTSPFYTDYSYYTKIAPYYSVDCSGFVSYSWQLETRCHTGTLPSEGTYIGQGIELLQIGDCLNDTYSHAALVTDVQRWADGTVASVEIMEGTPHKARCTRYGYGGKYTLEYFISYYFGAYHIYRNPDIEDVTYTHFCEVPIDGDYCESCRERAPYAWTRGNGESKTIHLSHKNEGAVIYYTLDGSEPTTQSAVYSEPITVTETTLVKAKAITPDFEDGRVLTYNVAIEQAVKPVIRQMSGMYSGGAVSYGSSFSISTSTDDAVIYYTLDGSEPTKESEVYDSPIYVTEDATILAMADGEGYRPSDTAQLSFTIGKFMTFTDVTESDWFYNAVEYAYASGLFSGTADNTFSPNTEMTRGMFLTVLARTAGIRGAAGAAYALVTGSDVNLRAGPSTDDDVLLRTREYDLVEVLSYSEGWYEVRLGETHGYIIEDYIKAYDGRFADLDTTQYYSAPVQWAALSGILPETDVIRAGENITREDMAYYLYNYVRALGCTLDQSRERAVFSDDSEISPTHSEAVYALQQAGVINGMDGNAYAPLSCATRGQVAQIFKAFTMAIE